MKNSIEKSLETILQATNAKIDRIKELETNKKQLKKSGIAYGTANYRSGKYLRIIKPSKEGGKREFIYIGADREKQKSALDELERGKKYDELQEEIVRLRQSISQIEEALTSITYQLAIDKGIIQ